MIPGVRLISAICLYVAVSLLSGCYGIDSNPRYSPDDKQTGSSEHDRDTKKDLRIGRPRQPKSKEVNPVPTSSDQFEYQIKVQINSYMGTPYQWGGASARGMDCSGFVSTVYLKGINHALPHSAEKMFRKGTPIAKANLVYGDLVFFENVANTGVSHVGIFLGNGNFAHASTREGVIVSNLSEPYYEQRYIGARRVWTPTPGAK